MLNKEEMIEKLVEHSIINFFEGNTRFQMEMLREVFTEDWSKLSDEDLIEFCIDYNIIEEEENA
jgi:hypothetical protein